jgi:hypothetical protein
LKRGNVDFVKINSTPTNVYGQELHITLSKYMHMSKISIGHPFGTNTVEICTEVFNAIKVAKKIEFMKQNIHALGVKHGFPDANITDFEGIIITMDYPAIAEYNGINILSIGQISTLV